MNLRSIAGKALVLASLVALGGCGDDGSMTDVDAGPGMDAAVDGGDTDASIEDGGADGGADGGELTDGGTCEPRTESPAPTDSCTAFEGDYAVCTDDGYDACVSDFGSYVRIQDSISSIARVEAFEDIDALLFGDVSALEAMDFIDARLIYQEDEGIGSRIERRYDPHFAAPESGSCTDDGVPETNPEYCVGPATLQPIILDAFMEGAAGTDMAANAGRIEGAMLWFYAVSVYKEVTTCTDTAKDCDSSWAYYTGGVEDRSMGIGLAGRIVAVDPYAHDRVWEGLLAQRCWRDLDDADTATDLTMRDAARGQTDRAIFDGAIAILRARLAAMSAATDDDEIAFHWAFVQTFGDYLVREATARDADAGAALATALDESDPAMADSAAITAALDTVETCP